MAGLLQLCDGRGFPLMAVIFGALFSAIRFVVSPLPGKSKQRAAFS
jgi:hypothetical protein